MQFGLIVIQILTAWIYSHFLEYCLHRFALHNNSFLLKPLFKIHFSDHHRCARADLMVDNDYHSPASFIFHKEALILMALCALHIPVALSLPYAFVTVVISACSYFLVHRRAHIDHRWARDNLTWHYDHHMGKDQNCNWGVRLPIFDIIFSTRQYYKGTEDEFKDFVRKIRRSYRKFERLQTVSKSVK